MVLLWKISGILSNCYMHLDDEPAWVINTLGGDYVTCSLETLDQVTERQQYESGEEHPEGVAGNERDSNKGSQRRQEGNHQDNDEGDYFRFGQFHSGSPLENDLDFVQWQPI
jgi:hypothetical protein